MARVRSEDLAGIHRGDEVAALAGGAHVAGASGDLTGLRRGTDTGWQLAALRDATRGGEAGTQGDVTSVMRVSKPDDTASAHEVSALDIVADIRSGATVPGMDAPVLRSAVSPPQPPPGVKLGLRGGGGDPVRPVTSDFKQWQFDYTRLRTGYEMHLKRFNWIATRAFGDAISKINGRLIEAYVELGGSINALRGTRDESVAEGAYRALLDVADQAASAGNIDHARGLERNLASIDWLTAEFIDELGVRTREFNRAYVESRLNRSLDPCIDAQKVADWLEERVGAAKRRWVEASRRCDTAAAVVEWHEHAFLLAAQSDVSAGLDPRVGTYNRIRHNVEIGRVGTVETDKSLNVRLLELMADPSMHRPAVQGSEAGGATPPPFRTVDSGAAGRLGDIPRVPGPSSSATTGTDTGDYGRRMLDQSVVGPGQSVVGPGGEAHPGTAASRSGDARAMANPQLGAESTFWLRPVDPVPAPGTVRFDAGRQRAGRQPQHSGEAVIGGTAVHRPFVPTPDEMLDPNHLTCIRSWSEDAFEAERALIAGRLPPGFDSSRLMRQWRRLVSDTEFESSFKFDLLPIRAIDSTIKRFRTVEGGRGHIQPIRQLEAMKDIVDRALADAYGYRVDADWLATVDKFLKSGSAAQAVGVDPVSVASRGEDIVEGARTSLQPARVESAAAPGPTEWGAGVLSPGAWSPAQDPWAPPWSPDGSSAGELSPQALSPAQDPSNPRPQVRVGEFEVVKIDATQPVSGLEAGGRGVAVGPTAGWQAAETPGFGRLASTSAELAFSHREGIVRRLMAGEAVSAAPRAELIRRYERAISAGTIASPTPRARTAAALFEDLRRLFVAARTFPGAAASLDIDWNAIETMLRLLDASGHSA